MATKAINIVCSDLVDAKLVTFNIEVDSVVQLDEDGNDRVFSISVSSEPEVAGAVTSVLAEFQRSLSAPTNPVSIGDITL